MTESQATGAFLERLIVAAERQGWAVTQTAAASYRFHKDGIVVFAEVRSARDLVTLANGLLAMGLTLP
jgi:hypothetical protein